MHLKEGAELSTERPLQCSFQDKLHKILSCFGKHRFLKDILMRRIRSRRKREQENKKVRENRHFRYNMRKQTFQDKYMKPKQQQKLKGHCKNHE